VVAVLASLFPKTAALSTVPLSFPHPHPQEKAVFIAAAVYFHGRDPEKAQ